MNSGIFLGMRSLDPRQAFRWPMMMGIAVLGLFLVRDLFPDMSMLTQAGALIHQHYPDVTPQGWGSLMAGLANRPEAHAPELISGLQTLLGSEQFAQKLGMLSFDGTVNPEKILPSVLLMSVDEGMRGILLLALIAASMSTFDSTVNLATGLVVNDVYRKYLRPSAQTTSSCRSAIHSARAWPAVSSPPSATNPRIPRCSRPSI